MHALAGSMTGSVKSILLFLVMDLLDLGDNSDR